MNDIMSSKKFSDLVDEINLNLIPPHRFYSGHIHKDNREYLEEHSHLALEYFLYLVEKNSLEDIIDKEISTIFGKDALNDIKKIILLNTFYHDIGKINENFQMKIEGKKPKGDSKHSTYSRMILDILLYKMFPDTWDIIYLFSKTVEKHHTRLDDYRKEREPPSRREVKILKHICHELSCKYKDVPQDTKIFERIKEEMWGRLFLFLKLIYSLLVLSDTYSAFHFSEGLAEKYPVNTLSEEIIEKMNKSFRIVPYNRNLRLENSVREINNLRKQILIEAHENIKKILDKSEVKIFMLPVPTGGGKTNISMRLALDILEKKPNMKRIFYVFPYINIVEQNYDNIRKTLFNPKLFGKNHIGYISDIYSKSYGVKEYENEEKTQEIQKRIILDDNFLNNPVNVITTVNFFNSFIKVGGSNRYKLANLANSIVILDEIQTLSDKNIRLFYDFIKEASEALNIFFILMSATLPDMRFFVDAKVHSLIEKPEKYFRNPVFKRNEIILKKEIDSLERLIDLLNVELKQRNSEIKVLVTLNTVAASRELFNILNNSNFSKFEIILLNSTLSSIRRRKIIEKIKNEKKAKIIVSTQSIEAGVDIDCDFGIRDMSPLDSIEQIAGRINREADPNKSVTSKLYVIWVKRDGVYDSKKVYGGSSRYKITLELSNMEDILNNKKFDEYYGILAEKVKKVGNDNDNHNMIEREIMNLHYREVEKRLNVIEDKIKKINIFLDNFQIPIEEISEEDLDKIRKIASSKELKYLSEKYPIFESGALYTTHILSIWESVLESTERFRDEYLRKMVYGVINQLTISINNMERDDRNLGDFLIEHGLVDNKYGLLCATEKFYDFYSFYYGLDVKKIKETFKKDLGVIL